MPKDLCHKLRRHKGKILSGLDVSTVSCERELEHIYLTCQETQAAGTSPGLVHIQSLLLHAV